jgi:hypothetical protein
MRRRRISIGSVSIDLGEAITGVVLSAALLFGVAIVFLLLAVRK